MKQCPKCNFSCEDNDVICKNCGFLFLPEGFKQQEETKTANQPLENQSPTEPVDLTQNVNADKQPRINGMAAASLVLGIIGVVFTCCYGVGAVFGVIALAFGIISFQNIKKSQEAQKGGNMSVAGIILGIIAILIGVLIVAFIIANRGMFAEYMQKSMEMMQKSNA